MHQGEHTIRNLDEKIIELQTSIAEKFDICFFFERVSRKGVSRTIFLQLHFLEAFLFYILKDGITKFYGTGFLEIFFGICKMRCHEVFSAFPTSSTD